MTQAATLAQLASSGALSADTSGNVGIGTTTPATKLNVSQSNTSVGVLFNGTTRAIRFGFDTTGSSIEGVDNTGVTSYQPLIVGGADVRFTTSGTERMRVASNGSLLIGTTTNSGSGGVTISPDATAPLIYVAGSSSTNANNSYNLYSQSAGLYRFYVGFGGTVFATSTTISGISDQRLKENVRDLDDGLEKVLALKPRKFDWKAGKGKDIKDDRGFIAQEFETIFPDMIDEWKDTPPEGEEPYKAINANLIPTLVKAIQELKAELDVCKAEIAALKGV